MREHRFGNTLSCVWVNEYAAAAALNCSVSKLRQDRHRCRGIPYAKLGRSVRYSMADIQAYMELRRITPL